MKFLLKLFCLLSLLSSFSFADLQLVRVLSKSAVQSLSLYPDEYGFLKGREFIFFKSADRNLNTLRSVSSVDTFYILDTSLSSGLYVYENEYFFVEGVYKTGLFSFDSSMYGTHYYYFGGGDSHSYTLAYRINLDWSINCQYSENFDINSRKCVSACPFGQSWDYENGVCYSDCTDKNLNKFGFSNGTAQGGCVDCSNAFTNQEIASCVCSGFGSSLPDNIVYTSNPDSPFVSTLCSDGSSITFKKRSDDNPDKDKDKEKDKEKDKNENGNKDKDKPKGENNSTSSNNSGGTSGNGSSGGGGTGVGGSNSGNGSSGGGGTGVETKPNPNSGNGKQDGKSDGKQDGKGEEGKGDDAVAQKLDYGDLEKDTGKFEGEFKKAVDDSFSFVNDVKASLTDTIQKIKDGNLMSLKKGAVPTTCPLSFQIDMTYFSKNLTFDFCKIVSPVSSSLYILFYLAFFILFLVVTIKLFILTFMGW